MSLFKGKKLKNLRTTMKSILGSPGNIIESEETSGEYYSQGTNKSTGAVTGGISLNTRRISIDWNAFWKKFKNGLQSLTPSVVPSWLVREYMAVVNWSSQHLWEVSMEGLSGLFKAYCPINQITFPLSTVTTSSLKVGNYSFSFPVGCETKTCKAIFHDDAYCSLSIALSEWMLAVSGFGQMGAMPYATAGKRLCFRSLTRAKIEVTRVNMLVVPINSIDITGNQSPAVREIEATFLVLGVEILSTGIPKWLDRLDIYNVSSYVQTGTFGDIFGILK